MTIPDQQIAVQLIGPDELTLNLHKPVHRPGPHQILGKVECVGLCFSDMKLLHQFNHHPRKGPVVKGIPAEVLDEILSYVPGDLPTVPGHETVIRVVEVGANVESVEVGGRYLVQADWRDLRTAKSNGAFGYCFEGGLQQYVLLDERCTIAADGTTSYLLPAGVERSASATALVEPWACIEDAFIHAERRTLRPAGTLLLVVADGATPDLTGLDLAAPATKRCVGATTPTGFQAVTLDAVAAESVDDLVIVGADADLVERCLPLLAANGLALIATAGGTFGRRVSVPVGRVHYGNIRLAGTVNARPVTALECIPATGEIAPGQRVHVVGAAGPMGSMAVIRVVSLGLDGVVVEASDMAAERLMVLERKAAPVSARTGTPLRCYHPKEAAAEGAPDYVVIMVPVGPLVAQAIMDARPGGIINIFAGIPADVSQDLDLDTYCAKGLYLIGTSGSTMDDIAAVLAKVAAGTLDTNLSVAAVSGMTGALAGLEAVKTGGIPGKILVYPDLGDFPVTPLEDLAVSHPAVAAKLLDGNWTKEAEDELLRGL